MSTAAIIGKTLLNQFRVEEFITITPLGSLYRALDERNGRYVALTILPNEVFLNQDALKQLEEKSAALQALTHPNLIKYLGMRQTSDYAFLIEEWVDGPSLREVLDKAPISVSETLALAKGIGAALEALHRKNLIHAHLAPELIRINQGGEIKLGGISNAQANGTTKPSKLENLPQRYSSPEEINGRALHTASDIYSLAVMLYELITGVWINGGKLPSAKKEIERMQLGTLPPAPSSLNAQIPDHFSRMILWGLRKDPDERFKTTIELLSALALALKSSVDEIPTRITRTTGPASAALLAAWNFLPQPRETIASDAIPLQDRIGTLSTSTRKNSRLRVLPIFLMVMLAGILSLFWLVRPQATLLSTPPPSTPFAADYTPPPTPSALPKPTDPHGGKIAFTCTRGDYNQLCMINRDGSGLTQLTDMEASNYYPVFTPDGESLLFASNRNGSFDLYQLLFSQKQLFQITKKVGNVVSPDYSPDGRRIVFVNRAGDGPSSIWMVNADGLNPHLVYAGTGDIVAVAWSPDGGRIAYAMSLGVPQEYEIFTMNTDGKDHMRSSQGLKGIGGSVDWSPDGRLLLVYAGPPGDKNLFEIDIASGNPIQLTQGGNNAGASFSPDGLYIVFNSLRNDDQADLYIMRADGTNEVQLTNDPEPDWGPRWIN